MINFLQVRIADHRSVRRSGPGPAWINILVFVILLAGARAGFSQPLSAGSAMEDSTSWNVYHLGGDGPASYQFNYTGQAPAQGRDGCLRITSPQRTNILVWQPVTLQGGKAYVVDGAVKTGHVASFWCEVYLSTVPPVAGQDYSPNNNADVVLGFSTWAGCGPNVDGTFAENACTGRRIYTAPGSDGEDVTVYFALKTGSIASPMPDTLEVLVDNLRLDIIKDWTLLSTQEGFIDTVDLKVKHVSPFITVENFRAGLHAAPSATIDMVGIAGGASIPGQDTTIIADTMAVKVAGLNGTTLYPIELRPVGAHNFIRWVSFGWVDHFRARVWIPRHVRVAQLRSALTVARHATFRILRDGAEADDLAFADSRTQIVVTAEDGDTKTYRVKPMHFPLYTRTLTNYRDTVQVIRNKVLTLRGHSAVTITAGEDPLRGSMLNLKSEDVWLYFPNIKPSDFYAQYLPQVMVNGQAPVVDQNIRLTQYLQGTVVISHSAGYKPLEVFSGENLSGSAQQLGLYTYYRAAELGDMHDSVRSFRLKKGYMATFAKDEVGTGHSRVYVADREDVVIDSLPEGLYNDVSFIRVVPWRWVAKKGWTSGRESAEALNCAWQYDWDNAATSGHNVEYIPMRHNRWWNSFENINNKKNSTHALGFNEPERPDQANMTVDEAIALWPELLKSGLRLGSPSPSDGGLDWLFEFIDRCDALNYRVDFVAMHWYMGGQSPQQFYNRLKYVHERTGRPIWITEWNNGANWTCCKPTYAEQAAAIEGFLHMLDTASFVERYSLYEWVEDTRHMFYKAPVVLTPAGEVYRDNASPMAYNPDMAYVHEYREPPITPYEYIGPGIGFDHGRSLSVDIDNDGDLDIVYSGVDPTIGGILTNDGQGNFTHTDTLQGLFIPSLDAGDIEGDGDLDIIMAGWDRDHGWGPYARLLHNDGTGVFTESTPPSVNAPVAGFADLDNNGRLDYFMVGNGNNNRFYFQEAGGFAGAVNRLDNGHNIQDPSATWADVDKDQDIDFCVQAYDRTTSRRYTQLWTNNGDGTFTEQVVAFKQKHFGSTQFADIDLDGDLDMLLNGDGDSHSDGGSHEIYRLYLNDGAGGFTEGATFQNYRQNTGGKGSSLLDWDNDGDYDIVLTGWNSTEQNETVHIYLNDGTGSFTLSEESRRIPGLNRGTIEPGDFDGDGKTDLLLNGYSGGIFGRTVAFLYKNETAQPNTNPLPPATLQAIVSGDTVTFSWSAGSDAETPVNGLTYNLYVTDGNGKYFVFPNADIATGRRMTVAMGNAYNNQGWTLRGLPAGSYTFGVQSIDAAYAGSAFSPGVAFTVGAPASSAPAARMAQQNEQGEETESDAARSFRIRPNPAGDVVTIEAETALVEISVYSLTGQLLHRSGPAPGNRMDVSGLNPGTYIIKAHDGNRMTIGRFVKK